MGRGGHSPQEMGGANGGSLEKEFRTRLLRPRYDPDALWDLGHDILPRPGPHPDNADQFNLESGMGRPMGNMAPRTVGLGVRPSKPSAALTVK